MGISISRAKLRPPELPQGHISRLRLLRRLEDSQEKKLTLIVAGAGYGKSTLLAEWVQSKNPYLWYSLDAPDRDPAVFFAHLLAGLQEKWPELGADTQAILNRPALPDPERLMMSLLGEIEAVVTVPDEQRPLLVFDDYHRLGDAPNINAAIKLLLERLPSTLHVIISSRTPLDFTARLAPDRQINKLTNHDLRFHNDEILQVLHDLDISSSSVQQFLRQTEGWVAGLQLLRQTLQYSQSLDLITTPGAAVDPLADIYAYLAEELLAQQSTELQQFLLQTAILDTFSPEDCDAIFERSDSAYWLTYLTRQNLFTIHLQRDPDIYRYHHLLSDFLRRRLAREKGAVEIQSWHRRTATYYQQRQQWVEAFGQAKIAGDESFALQVMLQASQPMLLAGQFNTLEDWLQRFSTETYSAFPRLYSLKGDVWFRQGNYEQAMGAYQQAVKVAENHNDQQTLLHAWHGIGAIRDRTGDHENARLAFSKALKYADPTDKFSHLKALVGLANNQKVTHQFRNAADTYRQCLELAIDTDSSVQAVIMHNLSLTLQDMGEFPDALYWLEKALSIRRQNRHPSNISNSLNSMGLIQCALGDFGSARRNLEEAMLLCQEADSPVLHAYTLHSRGDLALAEQEYISAEQFYQKSIAIKETLQDVPGLAITWTMMGDLYRRQGNLVEAVSFVHRALEPGIEAIGLNYFLIGQTVLVQIWLAQGKAVEATDLLAEIVQKHETITENKFELMKCLWLLAEAQYTLGQSAHETLVTALALAQRWNYRFLLTTLAREYPNLLAEAVAAALQPTLVADLLSELGETAVPPLTRLLESPEPEIQIRAIQRLAALGVDGVWEPLSNTARSKSTPAPVRRVAKNALEKLQDTPPAPLFVTTLGEFTVRRGDQPILDSAWGSPKAQTLFKYLLQHAGTPVHREDLLDLFWPETLDDVDARRKARRNLNQLVFSVRQALEPYLPPRFLSRYLPLEKDMYQMNLPDGSQVDAHLFKEVMTKAKRTRQVGDVEAALAYYVEGVSRYQGDYLSENRFEDWCIKRREQLRNLAVQGFYELASTCLARNELETAVSYARRLLQLEPWHEEGCAVLVKALIKSGQVAEARRACQTCKEQLEKELDVRDSPILDELYRQISR